MVQAVWRRGRREDKRVWKDERERVCGVEKRSWEWEWEWSGERGEGYRGGKGEK